VKGRHKEIFHTKEIGLRYNRRFDIEGFALEYPSYNTSLGHYKVVAKEIKNYVLDPAYFSLEDFKIETKEEQDRKRKKLTNENLKKIGKKFPKFSQRSISGKIINNKNFKRKITVINFWFSTCSPCKKEIPQLIVLKKKYETEKIKFYAFSLDNELKINAFLKEHPFNYELIANAREFAKRIGIRYYPTNIIIDSKGKIQFFETGYKSDMIKQLSQKIEELLD
jgi:peroxiredoxin